MVRRIDGYEGQWMGDMLASQESRSTNARKSAFLSSGRRPGLDLHVLGRPNERPSQATKTLPPSMPNATFFQSDALQLLPPRYKFSTQYEGEDRYDYSPALCERISVDAEHCTVDSHQIQTRPLRLTVLVVPNRPSGGKVSNRVPPLVLPSPRSPMRSKYLLKESPFSRGLYARFNLL